MNMLPADQQKSYPLYELVALALTTVMVVLGLISNIVSLDWLFDSLYWMAGAFLVYTNWKDGKASTRQSEALPNSKSRDLIICLYLLVDAVLLALMALPYGGIVLLLYLGLSSLYGAAFLRRLNQRAIFISHFQWNRLFQPPALLITLGLLVPLICMYLPMLNAYQSVKVWSGPIVWSLPGTQYMNAGGMIDVGSTVVVRGYQVFMGHLVCLLLAGAGIFHLAYAEGLVARSPTILFMRVAIGVIVLWWLLAAKGYRSLDNVANLLFVAGCGLLLARLFFRQGGRQGPNGPINYDQERYREG